jgi:hypothetical protein
VLEIKAVGAGFETCSTGCQLPERTVAPQV